MKDRLTLGAMVLGLAMIVPAVAQVKPEESTSKVKKVMRYTKCAGFLHTDGQRDLAAVLTTLSASKGFQVTNVNSDAQLTPEFLSQFQVIIWDNNVNGGGSVPSLTARTAVMDFVNKGGGWLLVHGAADHQNTWTDLQQVLQTTFSRHGNQGAADVVFDNEALAHKELKWMMDGWPKTVRFSRDEWYGFQNSVRKRPGITVIATAANGQANILVEPADGSKDHTYIYAKEIGKGRALYTAMGHGGNEFYTQAGGFAAKAVWENLRYLAGDFQNGCTNKNSSNYNPDARVDDGSCLTSGVSGVQGGTLPGITVIQGDRRTQLNFPHSDRFSVELWDAAGAKVWTRSYETTTEVVLDRNIRPGVYNLVAMAGKNRISHRMIIF